MAYKYEDEQDEFDIQEEGYDDHPGEDHGLLG